MISPGHAELLAARLLAGCRTKSGGTHFAHARRVAAMVRAEIEVLSPEERDRVVVAALLHDVVEKAGVSVDELARATDDERVVSLVQVLTQRHGESDRTYLERCAADPYAVAIKRMDLLDKFVLDDARVPPAALAIIQRRAQRRLALLEQIEKERPQAGEAMRRVSEVVASVPPGPR